MLRKLSPIHFTRYRLRGSKHIFPTLSELVEFYSEQVRPPFKFPLKPIESYLRQGSPSSGGPRHSPARLDHGGYSPEPQIGKPKPQKAKAYSAYHYHPPKGSAERRSKSPPENKGPGEGRPKSVETGRRRKFADKVVARQKPRSSRSPTPTSPTKDVGQPHDPRVAEYMAAREKHRRRTQRLEHTPGADLYTVMFQTQPLAAALECDAQIHLGTAGGMTVVLDLARAELVESTTEPVFQLHATPAIDVTSVSITKKQNVAFELVGLHVSSRAGLAFRNANRVAFASLDNSKLVPAASRPFRHADGASAAASPPVPLPPAPTEVLALAEAADINVAETSTKDVLLAAADSRDAMREQIRRASAQEKVDQLRLRSHDGTSEAIERELNLQVQQMDNLEQAWLADLDAEEERILAEMEATQNAVEALHSEDVSAGLLVREFETYVERLERQRDELRYAVAESNATLSEMTLTKKAEEEKIVAFDVDIESATQEFMLAKELRNKCRNALQVLEEEQRACEAGMTEIEAQGANLAAEEALARAALIEEEDRLAQLLIEEQELLSFSRTKEMEAAARLAKQHLESLERNRALRELSEREAAIAHPKPPIKRTAIQNLLEVDLLGLDDVINSPTAGISDETRLAAAESQVRMLEEKLRIADAHLSFAEATSQLLTQYPNSTGVLLGELQRYEESLANAGLLDDGELSEFDSDNDDPFEEVAGRYEPGGDDISLFDEPTDHEEPLRTPSPAEEESARGLYEKLKEQAGGNVVFRHVRFVVTKVFPVAAQAKFSQDYPEIDEIDSKAVSESELLEILRDLQLVQSAEDPVSISSDHAARNDADAAVEREPSRVGYDDDVVSPDDEEEVEYGFGDLNDEGSENESGGVAAAHIKRVLHVWKMRDESPQRVSARRISTQLKSSDFG